jgi:hypothetical protein
VLADPEYASAPFQHLVLAAGDDDLTGADMLGWIWPVLAGIPGGRWMSYEIETEDTGPYLVRLRQGTGAFDSAGTHVFDLSETADLEALFPDGSPLVLVLLDDYVEQVMSLLDSTVCWLNAFDTRDPAVQPLLGLCHRFSRRQPAPSTHRVPQLI